MTKEVSGGLRGRARGLGAGSHTHLGGHGGTRWSQPLGIKLELRHPTAPSPTGSGTSGHSLTSPSLSFLVCKAVTVRLGAEAQGAFSKDTGVRFAVTPGDSDDPARCPGLFEGTRRVRGELWELPPCSPGPRWLLRNLPTHLGTRPPGSLPSTSAGTEQ